MGQIEAGFKRTFKEFIRNRSVLFWSVAWPAIWVLLYNLFFMNRMPSEEIPEFRASITVSMVTFAFTIAGMANLPGNVLRDREGGMMAKLKSMPVPPWKDFVGRIMGLMVFSAIAALSVLVVGLLCGARFHASLHDTTSAIALFFLEIIASAGIGLIIAALVRTVQGGIMTGVGLSVITASISGLFSPYSTLPPALQAFSRIYPVSSCNSAIVYLLVGELPVGYNPLHAFQVALTVLTSFVLFLFGAILYSIMLWGRD